MMSVPTAANSINNRTTPNLFLWVSRPDGTIVTNLPRCGRTDTAATLLSLSGLRKPQVYRVNGLSSACSIPLSQGATIAALRST